MLTTAKPSELETALKIVNARYGGNITWNRVPEPTGKRFRFTLRCVSSKGPGHRRSIGIGYEKRRRLVSACWHVHGHFFDALFQVNPNAATKSAGYWVQGPTNNWIDWNIGSPMYPMMFSEACDCNEEEAKQNKHLTIGEMTLIKKEDSTC